MTEQINEKRKFKRVLFPTTKTINAICTLSDDHTETKLKVANISVGGVGFIAPKVAIRDLQAGDFLTLNQIDGHQDLDFITSIRLEVKWILNSQILEHLGFGCEFISTPQSVHDKLLTFIANWKSEKN